jgi:glycosyltransferase involved in cell wall biosynthesis
LTRGLRIAALIPAHDVAAYVGPALDSVAAQSRAPDEIVVVDDGSRDGTAQAVRDWARSRATPVRLLAQPNAGAAAARNLGLAGLESELVALLDADDVWLPHHLARAEEAFARHPELALYFADVEVFAASGVVQPSFLAGSPLEALPTRADERGLLLLGGSVYRSLLRGNYMPVSSTVLARSAVLRVGGYDPRFINAADRDLNLRLSRVGPFACQPAVSARKRLREDSLSHERHALRTMRYRLAVLEKMLERAEPLALDAGERRATREALRDQAAGLLYAASCEGLAAYLEAWRQLLGTAPVAAVASPRHLLRACAHAAGWRR